MMPWEKTHASICAHAKLPKWSFLCSVYTVAVCSQFHGDPGSDSWSLHLPRGKLDGAATSCMHARLHAKLSEWPERQMLVHTRSANMHSLSPLFIKLQKWTRCDEVPHKMGDQCWDFHMEKCFHCWVPLLLLLAQRICQRYLNTVERLVGCTIGYGQFESVMQQSQSSPGSQRTIVLPRHRSQRKIGNQRILAKTSPSLCEILILRCGTFYI